KEIENIKKDYPELSHIQSSVATENMENLELGKEHVKYYNEAIHKQSAVRVTENKDGINWYYDYIYLKMPGATLYSGYVLLIISNDSREKQLLRDELTRFAWIMLGTLLPLSLLVYFRSRKIIQPIRML